ncbi:MAG TPA: lipopolysaccharide biosynthesis protein [Sphingobium sp.]|nr:lipopolysaccharide biosynthesis protein [Sphingobium sp.]
MTTADTTHTPGPAPREVDDLARLAKGGRTNVFGFLLRLSARIPFLFVAGRLYGADKLGRFALAVLVVEFAAQIATIGLKRGLAEQLSASERPQSHVVYDALLLCFLTSLIVSGALIAFPAAMFPNSAINGLDRLLPLIIFAIALGDIALTACAFRYDIGASVRARSIIEPWTISIAATALFFYSARDGLILAYVVSMVAAMIAAISPLLRHYGLPHGWRPHPLRLWRMARRNLPLAAADAIEWGTRRLDLWLLGLFATPYVAGIYYVAQQVASLPQKLKTSFEPILGPVISRNVAERNYQAIAQQVSQVGFWIIAAQIGIALALGIPGEAVMGLVGPHFVSGTGPLALLLIAEVMAAPAVVSEAALVYLARGRNLWVSIAVIALQAILTVALVLAVRRYDLPAPWIAACPALGLVIALGFGSLVKARTLRHIVQAPVRAWRLSLIPAAAVAGMVGTAFVALPHRFEWVELAIGVPTVLIVYAMILWRFGFGPADRALFGGGAGIQAANS